MQLTNRWLMNVDCFLGRRFGRSYYWVIAPVVLLSESK